MNKNDFWKYRFDLLIKDIDQYLDQHHTGPKIAAFDADGTCWFNDVGRDFFSYQCNTVFKDIWKLQDYFDLEKSSIEESLWWLAEVNHSVSTLDLIKQAHEALAHHNNLEFVPSQKMLIDYLKAKGVEVFIVTASVKWAVVPAAELLGIDSDHVLGVTTKLDPLQKLTKDRHLPLTWREGKPLALLEATGGVKPFLSAGNTMGDFFLLESSSKFKISVNSVTEEDSIFKSEQELKGLSEKNNWIHFDYLLKS